jgi:hypothetical protein
MKTRLYLLIILAFAVAGPATAQSEKELRRQEEYKNLNALIDSCHYIFKVQSISPSGSRTIHTNSTYILTCEGDTFQTYLPYFGRAYVASYGSDGGIAFEGAPEDLKITRNEKKRTVTVSFSIAGENDKYDVSLVAGSRCYATLNIIPDHRQPISYFGTLNAFETP